MSEKELAKQFSSSAHALYKTQKEIDEILRKFSGFQTESLTRTICHNLYYALYHDYLSRNPSVLEKTAKSRHLEICKRLKQSGCKNYPLYKALYDLRHWADYGTNKQEKSLLLDEYCHKVHRRLKEKR